MKAKLFLGTLLALLLVTEATPASEVAITPPLKIITEEWPPFNYSENGEIKGFATDVIKLVMKEINVAYKIDILPASRGMKTLNQETRVLFFSFIMTPERKSQYKWIGPFGDQAIHFYKRKDSPLQIKTLEDAKNVGSICCRDMGLVYTTLKNAGFNNLDVGSNPEGSYLKAIHGRCDLAIGETTLGVAYWLKKSNYAPTLLEQTPVKITDSPLYMAVSKDVPDEEILRWQRALEKVKSSKEYSKLYQSYKDASK